jgi:hypothetical protein
MRIAKQLFPTHILVWAFLLSVGFPIQGMALEMSSGLLPSPTSDSVESNSFITIVADGVETKIPVGDPIPSIITATSLTISGPVINLSEGINISSDPVTTFSESKNLSIGNGSITTSGSILPSLNLTSPTLSISEPVTSNSSISIVADGVETTVPAGDPVPSNITATTLTISNPVVQPSGNLVISGGSFTVDNNLLISAGNDAASVVLNTITGSSSSSIVAAPITTSGTIITHPASISISDLETIPEITESNDGSVTSAQIKNGTIQLEDLDPSIPISGKDDADGVEITFSREFDYTYIPQGESEAVTIKALDLNGTALRINQTDPTVTLGGQPRNVLASADIPGTDPALQQVIVDLPAPLLAGQYKLKLSNLQGNSELHIPLSNTTSSAE